MIIWNYRRMRFILVALCCVVSSRSDAFDSEATQQAEKATSRLSPSQMQGLAERVVAPDAVVCDAAWLPIRDSKTPNILASIDVSGRHFCNQLVRIALAEKPSAVQDIETWMVETPASILHDLDQDGFPELVVPVAFSPYEGAQGCVAVAPVVYACSSNACADAHARFSSFYESEARYQEGELLKQLAVSEVMGSDDDREGLPCAIMVLDKLRRLAGIDRQAGFDVAMKWRNSSDPILRRKAVAIFHDIDNDRATEELEQLAQDRDPRVAEYAQMYLRK